MIVISTRPQTKAHLSFLCSWEIRCCLYLIMLLFYDNRRHSATHNHAKRAINISCHKSHEFITRTMNVSCASKGRVKDIISKTNSDLIASLTGE